MRSSDQIAWTVLLKCAAAIPTDALWSNVKRVAGQMKQSPPSKSEFTRIFPHGWESGGKSWQEQFLASDWVKNVNSKKLGPTTGGGWVPPEKRGPLGISPLEWTILGGGLAAGLGLSYWRHRQRQKRKAAA